MEIIYIIIFIVIILFILNKYEKFTSGNNNESRYAYVAPHVYEHPAKYAPEYYHILNKYPYWYNAVTPFPWNNPTRFDTLNNYPYTLIHDYFYPRIRYY